MEIKVRQFMPHGFSANCYAVSSKEDIALIDVGAATDEIVEFVKQNSSKIKYILLTHDHFDHICGVSQILKFCNAEIGIHKNDASGLADSTFSLCNMAGLPQPQITPDYAFADGDSLPFGDGEISVIHTPGHTDGCVCYRVGDILFSGDTLFFESVGRTDFVTGDSATLLDSLKRIIKLKGIARVYTGHGESTTLEHEREHNFFINYEDIH